MHIQLAAHCTLLTAHVLLRALYTVHMTVHCTLCTAHHTTQHKGYDKAGEQAKGYIALGVMLGACVFVSLVAVCLQSDFSLSQVSPVRTRAVVTVPTTVVAAPPAPPAAPAAVDDAPPAYHPAMGVQYDSENAGVKTSAF